MAGKYSPRHGLRELGWPAKLVGALVALVLVAVLLRGPTLLGGCEQSRPLFPGCAEPCNLGNAAAAAEAMTKAWPSHTDTPGMVIKERCEAQDVETLKAAMFGLMGHNTKTGKAPADLKQPRWISCPGTAWLDKLAEVTSGDAVFIDIGCNQGYSSAAFFSRWVPELGMMPAALAERLPSKSCGACEACKGEVVAPERPLLKGQARPRVNVVCMEPSQQAFTELFHLRESFFNSNSTPWAQWKLVNAAPGEDYHVLPFTTVPRCEHGSEHCDLADEEDDDELAAAKAANKVVGWDTIPIQSVDSLLSMHQIEWVDVLKIDAGGNEASAIVSAHENFREGHIGILAFEYDGVGLWLKNQLKDVVSLLNGFHFTCYVAGQESEQGSLNRLTGCWHKQYEYRSKSTIVCVRRDHPLYPHVERMTLRYHLLYQNYYTE